MKDKNIKILEFKTTKEPVKVLGVHLSYNAQKCIEADFCTKINKMKMKLNLWLSRDLSFYGKSLLVKALGVSQLVYAASMLTIPELVIKTIQATLFSFLWKNRKCASHLQKGESTLSALIDWLNLYFWLGLADYWVNQMTNGNQSRIITSRITEASPFSSNVIIM